MTSRKPKDRVDKTGKVIPTHLVELFNRRDEIGELVRTLNAVRSRLTKAHDDHDPLYFDTTTRQVKSLLKLAVAELTGIKPYAICSFCQGDADDMKHCRVCQGRGVLGKFRHQHIVPDELKT